MNDINLTFFILKGAIMSSTLESEQEESETTIYTEHFRANPHYYDYIHWFKLFSEKDNEYGTIKMCAGGGQKVDFYAEGEYSMNFIDKNNGSLVIKNLTEKCPYNEDPEIEEYPEYEIGFKIEDGQYLLGPGWRRPNHMEEELLVAKYRWIFEKDPLIPGQSSRENNLMYVLGDMPDDSSECIYYTEYDHLTRQELKERELPLCNGNIYSHQFDLRRFSKTNNLLEDHFASASDNITNILNCLDKFPKYSRSEILSYYDNKGSLQAFSLITKTTISRDDIFIFHGFFFVNNLYFNEIKEEIILTIKNLSSQDSILFFPPNIPFSYEELGIKDSALSVNHEKITTIRNMFPFLNLQDYTIIFPSSDD